MNQLTKAEEQVMQILWKIEKGFVKEIVAEFDTKPAYNTISTIVRILEKKGFVSYKAYGKTHEYYPVVNKDDYARNFLNGFLSNYFNNSFKKMVSFFSKEENMSIEDLEKIRNMADELIQQKKKQ